LVPLAITASLLILPAALNPRLGLEQGPDRREAALHAGIVTAALVVAVVLPSSGLVILLRGALTDILALICVSYLCRSLQSRHGRSG
jgi:hypothetical protein